MDTQQRAQLIRRATGLEQRGEQLQAELTLNPDRTARFDLGDQIADLGEELAELRREAA
jgi:hypothetical protein